jgi:hypothetical protein
VHQKDPKHKKKKFSKKMNFWERGARCLVPFALQRTLTECVARK